MSVQTKTSHKHNWLISLALMLFVAVPLHAAPLAAFDLITPQEAGLPKKPFPLESAGIGRGPSIEIHAPKMGIYTPSPFEVKIYFKAFGGATIDPNSIEILYWTDSRRDLTTRMMPYFKDNTISISEARAPRGQHEIQVSVTDSNGFGRKLIYDFQVD
ncbi:MAG: hypothetical protein JSS39_06690 [Nitrospira sp.]|nr:hypothetical protein [Nitrospira sp.]